MTTLAPSERLAPLVRTFTVVEASEETTRLLIPDTGIVLGFRYRGSASLLEGDSAIRMPDVALTAMRDTARRMCTSAGGGIILATFHEGTAAQIFAQPLHELFGATVPLEQLIPRAQIEPVAAAITRASGHAERVALFEQFLLARRLPQAPDQVVASAVRAIRAARGATRIGELAQALDLGQDRLEKRFRRAVGATPKQLASLLRLRHAIASYRPGASLTSLSVDAGYFDQSHFIRELRSVTGQPPLRFFRTGQHC
jgi:AraC-like DNA-binding protein